MEEAASQPRRRRRISDVLPAHGDDPAGTPGRRYARYPLDAEVEVLEPEANNGFTINASVGGLRLVLEKPIPEGAFCTLRVKVSDRFESMEQGHIVWTRSQPDGVICGLAFDSGV